MHGSMQESKCKTVASNGCYPSAEEMHLYIRCAWENGVFSQAEAAAELGVDQGQVSKIVNGHFRRPGGHAARLFAYAKGRLEASGTFDTSRDRDGTQGMQNALIASLLSAWDGTTRGAEALIDILNGARQLQRQDWKRPQRSIK